MLFKQWYVLSPSLHRDILRKFVDIFYGQATNYKLDFIHRLFVSIYKILVKFSCYVYKTINF